MKAQLSFEMQLYIALAGMALLFSLSEIAKISPSVRGAASGYRMMEFVDILNENVLSGNSTFVAYIPGGACNSTVDGTEMKTVYGSFGIAGGIALENSPFCPDGMLSRLYLSYGARGGVAVSR